MNSVLRTAAAAVIGLGTLGGLTLAFAPPAQAQMRMMMGPGGGRGGLDASITTDDIESMSATLKFAKDQREAVDILFQGYQDAHAALAKDVREKMEAIRDEVRETQDFSLFRKMGDHMATFRDESLKLEKSFFDDVKTVLTPEQSGNWPVFERERRRVKTLPNGLMSGERVDVVKLVGDLKLSEEQMKPIAPVIEQYRLDLDRALESRNRVTDKAQEQARTLFQNFNPTAPGGGMDMDAINKMWDEARKESMKVREVNQRYARQVEGLLPEDRRGEFDDAVRRASFPTVYRSTHGQRVVDAAVGMGELDADQAAAVKQLRESYVRELATLNRQMETHWSKREETLQPGDMFGFMGGGGGGGAGRRGGGGGGGGGGWNFSGPYDTPEINDIREKKRELDRETVEKVKALLTPEQAAKLPQRGDDEGAGAGERRRPREGRDNR